MFSDILVITGRGTRQVSGSRLPGSYISMLCGTGNDNYNKYQGSLVKAALASPWLVSPKFLNIHIFVVL